MILREFDLERFRKTGQVVPEDFNPAKDCRMLLADLRYLANSAYPRLSSGLSWGDWTLEDVYSYFAEAVNILRSKCYISLMPPKPEDPEYDTSYWKLYREVERKGLIKFGPPKTEDELKQWEQKRRSIKMSGGYNQDAVKVAEQLASLDHFVCIPDFLSLTGSFLYPPEDRPPRDIDIIIKAEQGENGIYVPLSSAFFIKLNRAVQWATNQAMGRKVLPDYPPPSMSGPNFPHIPIADLVVRFKPPSDVIEPDEFEFGSMIYRFNSKESLRVENFIKDAEESKEKDSVEPFRFYYPCKPVRPPADPSMRQTPESMADLFTEEDYKAGLYVSEKRDGIHVIVMRKGEKVVFYSEDGSDITDSFDACLDSVLSLPVTSVVLEAELEGWVQGRHLPREQIAGIVHSRSKKDYDLILNIFDCLYINGKDIHKEPYKSRWEELTRLKLPSQNGPLDPKESHINLIPHKLIFSRQELLKITEELRSLQGSEGVVVCKSSFRYSLTGRPYDNEMTKFHNNVVFTARVIEPIETKVKGIFNLRYGILPGKMTVLKSDIEEAGGEELIEVGKSFAAPYVDRGKNIKIEAETINVIYRYDKAADSEVPIQISAWAPRFMGVTTDSTDTIEDLIERAKKENHVVQYKYKFRNKTVYSDEELDLENLEQSQPHTVAFFTDGPKLDSKIVPKDEAEFVLIVDLNTLHYYIESPSDHTSSDVIIDSGFETPLDYLRQHSYTLSRQKTAVDPYLMPLSEDRPHKFIWEHHWRVGLKDLLEKMGREDLFPAPEPDAEGWMKWWQESWPEVKDEIKKFLSEHPEFSNSPSVHADFRYEIEDDIWAGWTVMVQIPGMPKTPPLDLEDAKRMAEDQQNWKVDVISGEVPFRIKKGGAKAPVSLVAAKKAGFIPPEWGRIEGVFPPKTVPSTRYGYSILDIVRRGTVETGYITSYAKEYFLSFDEAEGYPSFKWHVMFRYLRRPFAESQDALLEEERIIPVSPEGFGKEETGWLMIFMTRDVPYYLTKRAIELKHVPPFGYSGLPSWIRKKVPEEYQYWKIKDDEERFSVLKSLVEAIDTGQVDLIASLKVPFELYLHQSDPEEAIKRKVAARRHYDLIIRTDPIMHIELESNVSSLDSSPAIVTEKCTEIPYSFSEPVQRPIEIEKGKPGAFTKNEAAYIIPLDHGQVAVMQDDELFKKFKFSGKQLKGLFIMRRSDATTDIWDFSRSEGLDL
ncbi:MAG: hypothetical protein QXT73_00460 [Candidatus Methanomethylicaceae archaeon]